MTHRRFACSKVLALVLPVTFGLACGLKRDWSICAPDEKQPCLPGYVCTPSFSCVLAGDGGSDSLLAVDSQGATDVTRAGAEVALSVRTDASDAATGPDGTEPDRAPAAVPPDAAVSTVPDGPPVATLPDAASVSLADGPSVGLADAPPVGGPPDAPVVDAPPVGSPPDAPVLDAPPVDAPGTCAADKDCPALSPLCLGNRCAKCAGANDCTGRPGTPVCATSGLCVACAAGTQQCNGLQPQTCNVSGAWQNNGSACPYVCNNATGACSGACALNAKKCSGSQPQTCDANGAWQNTGSACSGCYTCSTATGACAFATGTPCDDGNPCTTGETCQAGVCSGGTTMTCPTPAKCRGAGTCDPSTGICNYPLAANNSACTDGNACTQFDSCQGGVCVGTPMTCPAPTACHVQGTCSAGTCSTPTAADGTTDAKCPSLAPRCLSGGCVQCLGDQHCSGSTPSCDLTTHTCVCRRPSTGNLVRNPGFDLSSQLTSWNQINSVGSVTWSDEDSEGCLGSGSAAGDNTEGDPSQCVQATGGVTYYFGVKFKMPIYANTSYCEVSFLTTPDCSGTISTGYARIGPTSGTWDGPGWASFSAAVPAAGGTQSAFIQCALLTTKLDQFYLNKDGNSF